MWPLDLLPVGAMLFVGVEESAGFRFSPAASLLGIVHCLATAGSSLLHTVHMHNSRTMCMLCRTAKQNISTMLAIQKGSAVAKDTCDRPRPVCTSNSLSTRINASALMC